MIADTRRRAARPPSFSSGLAAIAAGIVLVAGAHAGTPVRAATPGAVPKPASVAAPQAEHATLDAALARSLDAGGKADLLITLREKADLAPAYAMDWTARGRWVYRTLKETAERTQAPLRRALEARGAHVESNWITNTLVVRDGDRAVADAAQRSARVARVERLPATRAIDPELAKGSPAQRAADGIAANIAQIRAPLAWADGTTGIGVTIGLMDHAPLVEHEALARQFRGWRADGSFDYDYNWFNPEMPRPPNSDSQHGSHVLGIMIGDNHAADPTKRERIGVAPGAQWIGCEGYPQKMPTTLSLLRCAQFMLAPTKMDGTGANPDLRPVAVNNSWFTFDTCNGGTESAFRDAIDAWTAAGIVPVFAQGNTQGCNMTQPPGLQSVPAPASLASVFAVGSSGNHDGLYAPHSMWGPTTDVATGTDLPDPRGWPQLKPQVVAPGVTVRSAISTTNGYMTGTGTSMSAPHVTGAIALMIDAGPCLRGDYARLGTILMQTARAVPYDTGGSPAPGPGNVPNYATGWGELDAYAAVNAAAAACGAQGFIRGHVRDAAGEAIAGAIVEIYDGSATPLYRLVTEADGGYTRRLPQNTGAGYRVHTWAYGYIAGEESGLAVAANANTVHDVTLARAPTKALSGTVRDAATGWPLHARIAIDGYPGGAVWTDPVSGFYAVTLPTGTRFRLDVSSDVPGYLPQSRDVADAAAANGDFSLAADLVQCAAPGYAYAGQLLSQDFESNGSALPAGWTRSSAGLGWQFGDAAALSFDYSWVPPHGRFAAANDVLGPDYGQGNDGRVDYLVPPPFNLTGVTNPVLRFSNFFPMSEDSPGSAVVEGSRDGGATWQPLGQALETADPDRHWVQQAMSLAPLAGVANARVRFHADDGSTNDSPTGGTVWAIDDVSVRTACAAPTTGGLVVGHVRDANDAAPLDGAEVRVGNGASVHSMASADPAVGNGFYVTYAPVGAQTVHAARGTNRAGYADAQANVTLVNGRVAVADLALTAGRLRVFPSAGPTASVALGTTATTQFTVRNHGGEPLAYAFQQAPIEEHFDVMAFPPPGWTSTGAGKCPWRALRWNELNMAGGDTGAAIAQGADCFGDTSPYDVALVTPSIDLSTSQSAAVGFFLSLNTAGGVRLDLDVSTDAGATWHTEWSAATDISAGGPGELIERDLSAYAGAHDVRVRFRVTAPQPAGNVIVDQVHLFNSASSSPLFDLTPDAGTLAAGASRDITATFDARNLPQPGVYAVPLRIAQNTPYDLPYGDVLATMTVVAPAGWGAIAGTVRGLGECDASPYALAEAQVEIADAQGNSFTTMTDADGKYRYWRPAADGPFTVTVSEFSHVEKIVPSVAITAGGTTPTDVDLRVLLPCIATAPGTVSADVPTGQNANKPFDVVNLGPAPGPWALRPGGDPTVRVPKLITQTGGPDPSDFWRLACGALEFDTTLTNTYMRVFPLKDSTDPSDYLTISGVEFGITEAFAPEGTQPAFVRLYALDGELRNENLRLLREQPFQIPDALLARQRVPLATPLILPRTTVLVAAIYSPTGTGLGRKLYIGTNMDGESAPGYWMTPDCDGLDQPTPISDIERGFALLLDIEMQTSDACGAGATPVSWLGVSPANGTLGGDAGAAAQATFNTAGLADGTHQGSMCLSAPNTVAPIPVPVTLRVGAGDIIFRNGFDR